MKLSPLTAIGPLDGRYASRLSALSQYFSEYALIRYRIHVEVEYLIALHLTGLLGSSLSDEACSFLRKLVHDFSEDHAGRVKEIERTTNHDVKAVEYFIKEKVDESGFETLKNNKEFIHFGLTSQDINNTALPLMLKEGIEQVYIPSLEDVIKTLSEYAASWKKIPMLARTHGQAASPTTLGKEVAVFVRRLEIQLEELKTLAYPAKFGGATGNMNAHYIAYPDYDWQGFAKDFVADTLGLSRSYPTTQIEHYDGLGRIFDCLKRINTIVIDLCQDMWLYISMDYFGQKIKKGEIGSSAMPHKVNPIDFENAEGNCGMSTAILEFLSRKLPVSRLQRDLTDSTILRNQGLGVGYAHLAHLSLLKGLGKLLVNESVIRADLDTNWAVLAEAIQTILRREGHPNPYEQLLKLTRGQKGINEASLTEFVRTLEVSDAVKSELLALRPELYIGDAGD